MRIGAVVNQTIPAKKIVLRSISTAHGTTCQTSSQTDSLSNGPPASPPNPTVTQTAFQILATSRRAQRATATPTAFQIHAKLTAMQTAQSMRATDVPTILQRLLQEYAVAE
jgi:uncharacterized lipoprotein YajG